MPNSLAMVRTSLGGCVAANVPFSSQSQVLEFFLGVDIGVVEANDQNGLCFGIVLSKHANAKMGSEGRDSNNYKINRGSEKDVWNILGHPSFTSFVVMFPVESLTKILPPTPRSLSHHVGFNAPA